MGIYMGVKEAGESTYVHVYTCTYTYNYIYACIHVQIASRIGDLKDYYVVGA